MMISKLPSHEKFSSYPTVGPNGAEICDINGRAVAIEAFLDLSSVEEDSRQVRWTAFDRKLKRYQGEIVGKDDLIRKFKNWKQIDTDYDLTMLYFLLDHITEIWTKHAANKPVEGTC